MDADIREVSWPESASPIEIEAVVCNLTWLLRVVLNRGAPHGSVEAEEATGRVVRVLHVFETHRTVPRRELLLQYQDDVEAVLEEGFAYLAVAAELFGEGLNLCEGFADAPPSDRFDVVLECLECEGGFAQTACSALSTDTLCNTESFCPDSHLLLTLCLVRLSVCRPLIPTTLRQHLADPSTPAAIAAESPSKWQNEDVPLEEVEMLLAGWISRASGRPLGAGLLCDSGAVLAAVGRYNAQICPPEQDPSWDSVLSICSRLRASTTISRHAPLLLSHGNAEPSCLHRATVRLHLFFSLQQLFWCLRTCPLDDSVVATQGMMTVVLERRSAGTSLGMMLSPDMAAEPFIAAVVPDTPADLVGLVAGMRILSVDSIAVHTCYDVARLLASRTYFSLTVASATEDSIRRQTIAFTTMPPSHCAALHSAWATPQNGIPEYSESPNWGTAREGSQSERNGGIWRGETLMDETEVTSTVEPLQAVWVSDVEDCGDPLLTVSSEFIYPEGWPEVNTEIENKNETTLDEKGTPCLGETSHWGSEDIEHAVYATPLRAGTSKISELCGPPDAVRSPFETPCGSEKQFCELSRGSQDGLPSHNVQLKYEEEGEEEEEEDTARPATASSGSEVSSTCFTPSEVVLLADLRRDAVTEANFQTNHTPLTVQSIQSAHGIASHLESAYDSPRMGEVNKNDENSSNSEDFAVHNVSPTLSEPKGIEVQKNLLLSELADLEMQVDGLAAPETGNVRSIGTRGDRMGEVRDDAQSDVLSLRSSCRLRQRIAEAQSAGYEDTHGSGSPPPPPPPAFTSSPVVGPVMGMSASLLRRRSLPAVATSRASCTSLLDAVRANREKTDDEVKPFGKVLHPLPPGRGGGGDGCNKRTVLMALKHTCLHGVHNTATLRRAVDAIEEAARGGGVKFILVIQSPQQPVLKVCTHVV